MPDPAPKIPPAAPPAATAATAAKPASVVTLSPSQIAAGAGDGKDRPLTLEGILADMVADGMVAKDVADKLAADRRFASNKQHPLMVIAEQKWKDPKFARKTFNIDVLSEWLAGKVNMEYAHVDPFKVDFAAVTKVMSSAYASRYKILPIGVTGSVATVATCEPFVREWEAQLKQMLRVDIKRVIANPEDIDTYVVEFYNLARFVKSASEQDKGAYSSISNFEQLVQLGKSGKLEATDHHIVSICDWLFNYAFEQRASDIHIEPRRDVGNVRFRIDGVLHQVYQIPTVVMAAMTSRIKLLGRMDVVEKRRPQDGRIKTITPDGGEVELRLSTMPTAFGEKLVMRIFDPEVLVKDFTKLGFSEEDGKKWDGMISKPNGIILVTGPTGSGKTTTIYSTLKLLASPEVNVCSVEDPIEMVEPAINQMQVQTNIGVTFATGIRTLMRQDPDIIMVGEIRDLDTAEMAIQASLTGHLVLSTLHTNDAPSTVTRLLDLGVPYYLLHSTLLGIMAQRLIRTLCPHCKEKVPLDESSWEMLCAPWKAAKPEFVYAAKGCLECRNTGYMGRMGIYETMIMSSGLHKLISPETDLEALREVAYREGMKPLRISGALKVAAGVTTIEEIVKVAPPIGGDRRNKGR